MGQTGLHYTGQTGLHLWVRQGYTIQVRQGYTYGSDRATPTVRSVTKAGLLFCILGTLALFPREQAGAIVDKPHMTPKEKGMYSPNRSPDGTERQKIGS